jgi:hypothetical protein
MNVHTYIQCLRCFLASCRIHLTVRSWTRARTTAPAALRAQRMFGPAPAYSPPHTHIRKTWTPSNHSGTTQCTAYGRYINMYVCVDTGGGSSNLSVWVTLTFPSGSFTRIKASLATRAACAESITDASHSVYICVRMNECMYCMHKCIYTR